MPDPATPSVLNALLDSWDRHNRTLVNLLRALPEGGLEARALPGSPTVAQMLTHVHHERMVSVEENVPEHAADVPAEEWRAEDDAARIEEDLIGSARSVREAVRARVSEGRDLDRDYDHPVQLIAFLIFHEAYHHGQIKLALKACDMAIPDREAGPLTWTVLRARSRPS